MQICEQKKVSGKFYENLSFDYYSKLITSKKSGDNENFESLDIFI